MATANTKVRVWDAPVRLFHWLLVLLVCFSVVTAQIGGNWMDWHKRSGYAILTLVLFRIVWGFIGSCHARFGSFLRGPRAVVAYVGELLGRRPAQPHLGHNPLGGWSVVLMLLALLVQVGTGLFANDDIATEGPLYQLVSKETSDFLTSIHHLNLWLLGALIAVHVLAIVAYLVKGENLIRPMFTGDKIVASPVNAEPARSWLALVMLLLCALLVYALINWS